MIPRPKGEESEALNRAAFGSFAAHHKSVGGAEAVCPLGRRAQAREGEAGSLDGIEATIGRGKAKLFPLRVVAGAKMAC
jgi:hypothetical protein